MAQNNSRIQLNPLYFNTLDWQFCLWLVLFFDMSSISRILYLVSLYLCIFKSRLRRKMLSILCISFSTHTRTHTHTCCLFEWRTCFWANNISIRPPPNGPTFIYLFSRFYSRNCQIIWV